MTDRSSSAPDLGAPAHGLLLGFLALSPAVFWYGLIEPFEASKSALTQLAAVGFIVLAVTAALGRSPAWTFTRLRGLFRGPVGVAVLCGVLSAIVSTAFSLSPRTSLQGALDSNMGLGSVLALAVLFAASRALCRGEAAAEQVCGAAAVGLGLSCAYALVQALGHDPVRWARTCDYGDWVRPSGTLGHPNYVAGHAVMVLPAVLWLIRRAVTTGNKGRALAGTALAVASILTVLLSLSRGAWLAGALAGLVLLAGWRIRVSGRRVLALAVVLLAPCLLFFAGPDNRLKTALLGRAREHVSSPGRWPIWKGAVRLFADRPCTGSGLDTFGLAWPGVRTPEYWEVEWGFMPVKAHNDFLQALATQGLPGAAAYAMLPAALLLGVDRAWRRGRDRAMVLAGMAAAFYAQNLVGFAVAGTSALLAVVAGLIAGMEDREEEVDAREGAATAAVRAAAWLGVLLVLASLWRGGAAEEWRSLALVALALSWGAMLGLTACPGSASGPDTPRTPLLAWRPALLPSLGGAVVTWFVLAPLVASALSFLAEECLPGDTARALGCHEQAVRLASGYAFFHERRARALWHTATREPTPSESRELLLASKESIETACRLEPLSAPQHATRARILFDLARQGLAEPAEVLAAFDRALALDRCDWLVLADAAAAASALGHFAECERYLRAGPGELALLLTPGP
jgi:O-antigen ligase